MSIGNDTSPLPTTSRRKRWDPLSDGEKHNFRVQSTPPLSLRQFLRSTITIIPGAEQWKPAGIYHAPVYHEYRRPKSQDVLPKILVKSRKSSRPAWYPPGRLQYVRSTSATDENKLHKSGRVTTDSRTNMDPNLRSKATGKSTPPWHPSGNKYYEPIPYFDAPSLRWSLHEIKQSMPELSSRTNNSSMNQK
jgi:hypothetical protein